MKSSSFIYFWPKTSAFKIDGPSAERYLNGRCSQDVKSLRPEEMRAALILNPQGRVEGKFLIGKTSNDFCLFSDPFQSGAEQEEFLKSLLRFKVADQFEVTSVPEDFIKLSVFKSDDLVCAQILEYLKNQTTKPENILSFKLQGATYEELIILFSLQGVQGELEQIKSELSSFVSVGEAKDYEYFRINNKLPLMYQDLDSSVIAPDFPLESYISKGKGCYAGQEVVEMATARGRPNKRLVKIRIPSALLIPSKTKIFADDLEIGFITSSVTLDKDTLTLGFIKNKDFSEHKISIEFAGERISATICDE